MTPLRFPAPIDPRSASWSPTMALLLTTSAAGKTVSLHRPREGHTVWEQKALPDGGRCCGIVWAQDGRRVAVLTSKAQCLVYDVNSGKLLVNMPLKNGPAELGRWINVGDAERKKFHGLNNNGILKALPKFLPLPASFAGNLKFGTRQHIDALIQNNDDEIDLLILFGGNTLNIAMNSLFSLGASEVCGEENEIVDYAFVDDNHYLLTTSLMTMKHSLKSFDMKFDSPYLNKIGNYSAKILALLGYIDEVLTFLSQETKNYLDCNSRFLSILKDELDKRNESVSDELYNLLLTGMMNDDLKDWLQNTIGDRGVKKWEKLGEVTFDNVRRSIIYHLVPSCERLIILLSDLKSVFEILLIDDEDKQIINLIDESMNSVKVYLNTIFQFIIKINREQELFNSFISWINFVLLELQEEDPTSKYLYKTSEVSHFIIDNHLERSILYMLIPNFRRNLNQVKISSSDLFGLVKKQIRNRITKGTIDVELGNISDYHQLVIHNHLYVITKHETSLEIFKINRETMAKTQHIIQLNQKVKDFRANKDLVFILINDEIRSFNLKNLDNSIIDGDKATSVLINSLSEPSELSMDFNKQTACVISSDHQNYEIWDIR